MLPCQRLWFSAEGKRPSDARAARIGDKPPVKKPVTCCRRGSRRVAVGPCWGRRRWLAASERLVLVGTRPVLARTEQNRNDRIASIFADNDREGKEHKGRSTVPAPRQGVSVSGWTALVGGPDPARLHVPCLHGVCEGAGCELRAAGVLPRAETRPGVKGRDLSKLVSLVWQGSGGPCAGRDPHHPTQARGFGSPDLFRLRLREDAGSRA